MEKNELFQKLNNQDKDTLDLIRQLFNLMLDFWDYLIYNRNQGS